MKTLLWKDFRQNASIVIAAVVSLCLPYILAMSLTIAAVLRQEPEYRQLPNLPDLFANAGVLGLYLTILMCAFIAGNTFAGERADRSAEFAAYLPIKRGAATLSKMTLALGLCSLLWIVNFSILNVSRAMSNISNPSLDRIIHIDIMLSTSILIFGVAWLSSAISKSPALSAASGLVAVIIVAWGNLIVSQWMEIGVKFFSSGYIPACLVIGFACFFAGVIYYLRRTEP